MTNKPESHQRRLFGMTVFQIAVLFLIGLFLVGVVSFAVILIYRDSTTGSGLPILVISNPSREILGKWERYIEPTLTSTAGPSFTPIVMQDPFGNSYIVTPGQSVVIRMGCDFGYPKNIEFFQDGTYTGPAVSIGSDFIVWQGGQYEILDGGDRIRMETKNGLSVYNFFINGDILTFVGDNECGFSYQRVSTTTFSVTNIALTDTATMPSSPTWTTMPTIQLSPSRTKAPTWTSLPQMFTPTRTKAPTWTPLP
jgi:hypothetical protein